MTTSTPARLQLLRFGQHLIGLAHAGGVAEKHLQASAICRCRLGHQCGKHANVDAVGLGDQAIEQRAGELAHPAALQVVADEELRDAVPPRVVQDRADGIVGVEDVDMCLLRPGEHHVAIERHAILGRQVGLVDVDGEQLAVKAIRIPPAARQHRRRVGARRHADENALLRAPRGLDAVQPQIGLELRIDDVGGEQEGALSQLRQLVGLLRGRRFRRGVDDDDFIGLLHERLRHRVVPLGGR